MPSSIEALEALLCEMARRRLAAIPVDEGLL